MKTGAQPERYRRRQKALNEMILEEKRDMRQHSGLLVDTRLAVLDPLHVAGSHQRRSINIEAIRRWLYRRRYYATGSYISS